MALLVQRSACQNRFLRPVAALPPICSIVLHRVSIRYKSLLPGIFRLLVFPEGAMRHSLELWGVEMPVSVNRPADEIEKRAGQRRTRDVLKAMLTATAIRTGIVAVMVGLPTTGALADCYLDGNTVTCATSGTDGWFIP